jgi:hypothetical protein
VTITSVLDEDVDDVWLKGDLHMHSVHSDGSFTIEENINAAMEAGLDFIGLMDHNTASQNKDCPETAPLICIPGMELTTYKGHCNLFGAADPVADFRTENQTDMNARLAEARGSGSLISINHPFDPGCPWEWDWDAPYEAVEVWNGPWRPGNAEALEWWQKQLEAGMKIPVVGGSDTHRPDVYVKHGMPTTWVKCSERSVEGILAGIRAGRVCLSWSPEGPRIDLTDDENAVNCKIDSAAAGDEIKIISERGVEETFLIAEEEDRFTHSRRFGDRKFYRVEVWRRFEGFNQPLMAAMSNPVYRQAD